MSDTNNLQQETTFEQRLTNELNELESKIDKLDSFVNGVVFDSVKEIQKSLLKVQLSAMITYRDCLKQRIKNL
jgi:hypothetical protein